MSNNSFPILYHGSPADIDIIIPQLARDRLREDNPAQPQVCAQPDLLVAHAYALKDKRRDSMMNCDQETGVCRMIVTSEGTPWDTDLPTRDGKRGGFIYSLDGSSFQHLADRGEWISSQSHDPIEKRFVTIEDVMRQGVQLLVLTGRDGFHASDMWRETAVQNLELFLQQGLDSGGIIWLNQSEGINPIYPVREAPNRRYPQTKGSVACPGQG